MKKIIFFVLICVMSSIWFVFSDSKVLNFAYIEDTSYLNFEWQEDWKIYSVSILTWETHSIQWNDWWNYECFMVFWTWYTDTMWEIYFWYSWYNSYLCSDWSWRWYWKINAGWRIHFEDLNLVDWEDWWVNLDINYDSLDSDYIYHSDDWMWNWDSIAYSPWIWFWKRNFVKTSLQARKIIYDYIDDNSSTFSISSNSRANWVDKANMFITMRSSYWSWLTVWWFYAKEIYISTWTNTSFRLIDWELWTFFDWYRTSINNIQFDSSWEFLTWISSIISWSWSVEIVLKYDEKELVLKTNTRYNDVMSLDLQLSDWDWDWMILIQWNKWWYDRWVLVLTWGLNLISSQINSKELLLDSDKYYDVIDWENNIWNFWEQFNISLSPSSLLPDDILQIRYRIKWTIDISLWPKSFSWIPINILSDVEELYADKTISEINFTMNDCTWIKANWSDLCIIDYELYSKNWYLISLSWYDIELEDLNKNSSNSFSNFDINELDWVYTKWFYLESNSSSTDNNYSNSLEIVSYKPTIYWKLQLKIKNIVYGWWSPYNRSTINWSEIIWEIDNVFFSKVVNLAFEWAAVSKWIFLDKQNELEISFKNIYNSTDIYDWEFYLSWVINWCPNCSHVDGGIFNENQFWTYVRSIYITWDVSPSYVDYYSDWYKYKLRWVHWEKEITLKPSVEVLWEKLNVLWESIKLKILWQTNKTYNMELEWVQVIWSVLPFSSFVNDIIKNISVKYRWYNEERILYDKVFLNSIDEWVYIYRCDWDNSIVFGNWMTAVNVNEEVEFVLYNCRVNIKSDLVEHNDWDLTIYSFSQWESSFINYNFSDWRDTKSNIYIDSNVKTIMWNIYTNGSLLFSTDSTSQYDSIFVSDRRKNNNIKGQIYIKWQIFSRNTLWWWLKTSDMYALPGWRLVNENSIIFWETWIDIEWIAQWYDYSFARADYIDWWHYSTWSLSRFIYNEYWCTWVVGSDNPICYSPLVIEYDR